MLRFGVSGAIGALLLATFIESTPASASVVQALDLDELVEQSDRIVIARVVSAESFRRRNGVITTWYRFVVERELRNDAPDPLDEPEVIVHVMGGRIGDVGMRVEGEPSFVEGERALLFIQEGQNLVFRPVGMAQGVMRIRMQEGAEHVFQSREGLVLVRRSANGRLEGSPGALPRAERLNSVVERIRSIVRQQTEVPR